MSEQYERVRVLLAGICSLILAMGVARFAYTPLLPLMQHQAGLGVAAAGWLAAINYAGYLSGALIASLISDMVLKDRLYRMGMILAVASTVMMGLSSNLILWALSRFLAGMGSAAGLLLGSGLILNWLIRHNHRSELGIHFSGIGLGIACSAAAVFLMSGGLNWREQWLVLAMLGCLLLVPALAWFPAPDKTKVTRSGQLMEDAPPGDLFMRLFMFAYFCAGAGYVVSATFIVAIIDHMPGLAGTGTVVFFVIGVAAAPSCVVWDLIARRMGRLDALICASVLQVIGIMLPVLNSGLAAALAGAVLFGGTVMGVVSLVLTMAGQYYPTRPAKMMGKMTLSYGAAQIMLPAVTGWMAAGSGSYTVGLYLAGAAMVVSSLVLLLLRRVSQRAGKLKPD
jgi:predicted MFS family arabinose efflux permease